MSTNMYQFDFVKYREDEEEPEFVISVKADNYKQAIVKIRKIDLPDFNLPDWYIEGVYEQGTLLSERNN